MQYKDQLRDAMKERLARLSEKDREAESRSLYRRVLELLPDDVASVCAFVPMPDEVNVQMLLDELLAKDVPVFLPRFEMGKLAFRRTEDLTALEKGALGTMEPPVMAEELDPAQVSHVLVPGRAFDRNGGRLGRGNGGYDHWIGPQRNANPQTVFWGVCFDCQLVHEVPMEGHDERMDAVVTARGIV